MSDMRDMVVYMAACAIYWGLKNGKSHEQIAKEQFLVGVQNGPNNHPYFYRAVAHEILSRKG